MVKLHATAARRAGRWKINLGVASPAVVDAVKYDLGFYGLTCSESLAFWYDFFCCLDRVEKHYKSMVSNTFHGIRNTLLDVTGDFARIHFGLSMEFNIEALLTIYLVSLVLQMDNALIDDQWTSVRLFLSCGLNTGVKSIKLVKEAFGRKYEWKFMNFLEFWTSVVCAYSSEPDFRPLVYPFAQSHCCSFRYFDSWIFTDDEQPSRSKRTMDSGDDVHAVFGIDAQFLIKKCTHYEI
ncbi:hypothetical protein C5167_015024 [Papaver somniferum]|uniref:Uncharacterized protein n=1 Tax=Papaver somniferum TaxID=3469 RepID=A0A4Y7J4U9_PAPSO|nr:hypothetical protein C5167_015024 [Papaver somniferum]